MRIKKVNHNKSIDKDKQLIEIKEKQLKEI